MTYRELLIELAKLNDEQLNDPVIVMESTSGSFYKVVGFYKYDYKDNDIRKGNYVISTPVLR